MIYYTNHSLIMVFVVKLWLQATTGNKNALKTWLGYYNLFLL